MAIYEVQAPDGSILELEGPDNATPEQIGAAAKRAYAAQAKAPPAAPTTRTPTFQRGVSPEDAAAARASRLMQAQPEFAPPAAPQSPGLIAQIKEAFTGAARTTPEIEALPDIGKMPERNQFSVAGFKAALGQIAASGPEELVQVIGANFPDVQARVDAKGNYILRSGIDGREYAIKPGFQASDIAPAVGKAIPQIAASQIVAPAAAAMGLGKAAQLAFALGTAGLVQAATEEVSAMAGGTAEPIEVGKAIAGEALGQGVGAAIGKGVSLAKGGVRAAKQAMRRAAPQAATQTVEQAVEAAAAPGAQAATGAAPAAAAPAQPGLMEPGDLADLVRKASRGGIGSAGAKRELAQFAQFNPEARAQAEALGFELPMDVFADNPQVRAAAGLLRSEAAGAEEAAYTKQLQSAMTRADELMTQYGATFIEGKPASADVSDRVLSSLTQQSEDLASKAKPLFDEFNARVPRDTKIALPDLAEEMARVTKETVPSQLTRAERGLLALVKKGENGELSEVPYGALVREKQAIFDQLKGRVGNKYKDVDQVQLEKYYDILRKEQVAVADRLGDAEASQMLADANLLWAKKKSLDDLVVEGFGKGGDNSVAKLMKSAIKGAAEGDKAAFNKLNRVLDAVPPELRRETIATALATGSRSGQKFAGMDPGAFGFSEFAKMYQGLRANPEVYKRVVDALGPGSDETLRRMYEVSKRVADARANVLKTGKANQAFLARLNAEKLTDAIINTALRTGAGKMATAAMGSAAGGPIGAAIATGLISAAGTKKSGVQVATQMLASDEFKKLVEEAAVREVSPARIRAFVASPVFSKFANAVGLPRAIEDRDRWIRNALEAQAQQPEEQPTP